MITSALSSPLDRAAKAVKSDCYIVTSSKNELAFELDWDSMDCLLATWPALEDLGFDRADLERSVDEQAPVRSGDYQLRAVDSNDDTLITITKP